MARLIVANLSCCVLVALSVVQCCAAEPASKPDVDAWPLISKAAERVEEGNRATIGSPASSNLTYSDFPPFPPLWYKYEKASYAFNASSRALLREARLCKVARWPETPAGEKLNLRYVNQCRALANEMADAALYEHLQGDDAAAIETLRDELHLAELLEGGNPALAVNLLVAAGLRAVAMNRLEVIATMMSLTEDATDQRRIQVRSIRQLIRQLIDPLDPSEKVTDTLKLHSDTGDLIDGDLFLRSLRRVQMEQHLTAMALACHLFRFEKSRWPASVAELLPCLPGEPMDAWGKEGYAVVKLPDGGDRPMVYSRCRSKDGLFYRTDAPQYGFYTNDGSDLPARQQIEGGQFRDVSLWPVPAVKPSPVIVRLK